MAQSTIFTALLAVVFLSAFIIIVLVQSKKLRETPRKIQRFSLKIHYMILFVGLVLIYAGYLEFLKQQHYRFLLMGVVFVSASLFQIFQRQTENDIKANYARDPAHCGRCSYDLTGNTSGICPECGWTIPQEPVQYQRPDWACWWKQWQIDYLDNWRRKLAGITFWMVIFAVLGIVGLFFYAQSYTVSILSFLMSLMFAINFIRIIAYARRQR